MNCQYIPYKVYGSTNTGKREQEIVYSRCVKEGLDLKVASKPISKILTMTNFGFKQILRLSALHCFCRKRLLNNLKKIKFSFASPQNIPFWPHGSFKTIFKNASVFAENGFNFFTQKFAKKQKMLFLNPQKLFFYFSFTSKSFRKMFPMTNFRFKKFFEDFAPLSYKAISFLSLKNLRKS